MAKASKGELRLSTKSIQDIWKKITPADWFAVLQEYRPENKWAMKGDDIYGCCVYHNESTPSMHISVEKNFVHCFGCKTTVRNPLQFYQKVTNLGFTGAVTDLKKRFNLKSITEKYALAAQEIEDMANVKLAIFRACNVELERATQDPEYGHADRPGIYDPLRKFLEYRKYPLEAIHQWPVGVLPTRGKLVKLMSEIGKGDCTEAAMKYLASYVDDHTGKPGSLVFFNYTSPDMMGRIKIRPINSPSKLFYYLDDPHCEEVGMMGVNMFSRLADRLENYFLYVVEGETDALSLLSHSMARGQDDFCVVATGGSMEQDLDDLCELGFKGICLIPDNDSAGTGWAKNLMKKKGSVRRLFLWPEKYAGIKDIDEALRTHPIDEVFSYLEENGNIFPPHEWAYRKFIEDTALIPDSEISAKTQIAASYSESLTDSGEKDRFSQKLEDEYQISRSATTVFDPEDTSLEEMGEILANKIVRTLPLIGYESLNDSEKRRVILWDIHKKRTVALDAKATGGYNRTQLEAVVGGLESYVRREVGDVPRLYSTLTARGPVPLSTTQKAAEYNELLRNCISSLLLKSEPVHGYRKVSQGFHWVAGNPTSHGILVNGTLFLKATIEENSTTFEETLHPITHGCYLFAGDEGRPWSRNINSAEDILSGFSYDPHDLFMRIKSLLNQGWCFEDQDLYTTFLAADTLYTPIASLFSQMVPIDLNGPAHSGKTILMRFIAGHRNGVDPHICEASKMFDDFTAASVRQSMNGCSLRLFLDEFESTDEQGIQKKGRRADAVAAILGDLRSVATGLESTRGTTMGTVIRYHLHFPVTVAGIYTMADYRDMTRYLHVKTQKLEGHRDPLKVSMMNDPTVYDDLRRGVTLCFFPRLHEVRKAYVEVMNEFANNSYGIPGSMARLLESILPVATILKLAKVDYVDFVVRFCKAQAASVSKSMGQEEDSIWTYVLNTPIPVSLVGAQEQGSKLKSLESMLGDHSYRQYLNTSDIGIIFLEDRKWLVVQWQKVLHTILRTTTVYRGATDFCRLKTIADRDPRTLNGSIAEGIIYELNRRGGFGTLDKKSTTILDLSQQLVEMASPVIEEIPSETAANTSDMNM